MQTKEPLGPALPVIGAMTVRLGFRIPMAAGDGADTAPGVAG